MLVVLWCAVLVGGWGSASFVLLCSVIVWLVLRVCGGFALALMLFWMLTWFA